MSVQTETSDKTVVDHIRCRGSVCVSDLVEAMGVTATAVRQRLQRLMGQGVIQRHTERQGRGRPTHRYTLTKKGVRLAGSNFADLAIVLWDEVRSIKDTEVRRGLLERIADRFIDLYKDQLSGETREERMASIALLMGERDVPFEVDSSKGLPVISAQACPFPELAEQDRGVCAMEKRLISGILGENVRLTDCRLDGSTCCTFTPSVTEVSVEAY